ncbi:zeta toxin family protein [Nonomuraea sp. K274]|uniref:UDP-N-acetylglucosamine kinase n=1 Tax=Nonomuraea cypriaca TaxID=1187855 RepID=A0A931A1M3_9ACTN|nr:zeta toxin family protein [Nonomuraea cypriaca]MBF8184531.1 zeta toxin family protein [Nonomuraea cypriaca]
MAIDAGAGRNVSSPVTSTPDNLDVTIGSEGYAADVTKAWGENLPPLADALIALISSGRLWPTASESGEAALALAFQDLGTALSAATEPLGRASGKILDGYDGPAANAFREQAERLGSGESGLAAAARLAHGYALQHDSYAREIQYAKLSINIGFWVTLSSALVAALATFFSAGATAPLLGPYARVLRRFLDRIFTRLDNAASVRFAGAVTPKFGAVNVARLSAAPGAKGLLARAVASHALREVPEEVAEGLLIDGYAQAVQRRLGTRTSWDGRRTLATALGDAGGAVLASQIARPVSRLVGGMPGIRALNSAAGDAPGILNALRRYPGRAVQAGLVNGAVSLPAGFMANGVVYGQWGLASPGEVLGSMVAGAGRTNTISPFSVDAVSAIAHPGATLEAADAAAAASDAARAPGSGTAGGAAALSGSPSISSGTNDTAGPSGGTASGSGGGGPAPAASAPFPNTLADALTGAAAPAQQTSAQAPAQQAPAQQAASAQQAPAHGRPGLGPPTSPEPSTGSASAPADSTPASRGSGPGVEGPSATIAGPAPSPATTAPAPGPTTGGPATTAPAPGSTTSGPATTAPAPGPTTSGPAPGPSAAAGPGPTTSGNGWPSPSAQATQGPVDGPASPSALQAASARDNVVPSPRELALALSGASHPPQQVTPGDPATAAPSDTARSPHGHAAHQAPSQNPRPAPDHVLTEEEHRRIFHERIVPSMLSGATRSIEPTMIVVGGQPGAGKSTTIARLHDDLQDRGGAVRIIVDDYKAFHPGYDQLLAWDDIAANALIQPIAKKWQSMAFDYVIERHYNVIVEATLGNPEDAREFIQHFTGHGYRVETEFVATAGPQSRLSILTRYLGEKVSEGAGRFVPAGDHDSRFAGSAETAAQLESDDPPVQVDAIRVRLRTGETIFANERGPDGAWTSARGARDALLTERERPWSRAERQAFTRRLNDLRATLEKQRREHPDSPATYRRLAQEADAVEALARPWLARRDSPAIEWSLDGARRFESSLGEALFHDPEARAAADRTLAKLFDVLTAVHRELHPESPADRTEQAFFKDDPSSPGQVGRDVISLSELRRDGNLRMVMTALYNGAYFSKDEFSLIETLYELRSRPNWPETMARAGLDVSRLGPVLAGPLTTSRDIFKIPALGTHAAETADVVTEYLESQSARWSRTVEDREAFRRTPQDFLDRRIPLHALELAAQLHHQSDAPEAGPGAPPEPAASTAIRNVLDEPADEDNWSSLLARSHDEPPAQEVQPPLDWVLGTARYGMHADHPWYETISGAAGLPLTAGISGTAARLHSIFCWIRPEGVTEEHFARALLGWMLTTEDHSVYEIIRGIEVASPHLFKGSADGYSDAEELYERIVPPKLVTEIIATMGASGDRQRRDLW